MIDSTKYRKIAYDFISKLEKVKILESAEKEAAGMKSELEVWEINTEISCNNTVISIILHVVFDIQFPLDIPKIYLSKETYNKVKYIPHINSKRLVCTYDTEITVTSPSEPGGIVYECIRKSKDIIIDGINDKNKSDFLDEFKAYWEDLYEYEKNGPINILSLINNINRNLELKLIILEQKIQNYKYVLHNSDEISTRFKDFMEDYKIKFREVDVFYFGKFNKEFPPFELRNRDIIRIISSYSNDIIEKFKAFINDKEVTKLVICEKYIEGKSYLFGWFHDILNINEKGFRPGKLKYFDAISKVATNEKLKRVTTDVYTRERLLNRTSGEKNVLPEKKILIAGVGSIGSNLLYFLNSYCYPYFKLIDSDQLRLENIQRHFLGFQHIGLYKTLALKDYIQSKNPLQLVSTREKSIIDVLNNEGEYLNDVDYIFSCIGKGNIDNFICESLVNGTIIKPIFIIWVEPYLCGGHCIYLHPLNPEYSTFFSNNLFKYNVIDNDEYTTANKRLSLRESGCQTTYIPYSGANVINFLSSIFSYITSIIDLNKTEAIALTWVGNVDELRNRNVKMSNYYVNKVKGDVVEHII